GLASGAVGGAVGAVIGEMAVRMELPQAIGWMIMGLAIGGSEGFLEGSRTKLRNGLIGGGLGGLLGGWLFGRIAVFDADMAARACGFVVLGIMIGVLIGLTHVVLKEAWLTVVDGFRPGRELILSQSETVLGRGDHLPLPLLGYAGRDLESEHARIIRKPDGSFSIEDNRSRLGTLLNGQPIQGPSPLKDGDLIKLGSNIVRFRVRRDPQVVAVDPPAAPAGSVAPPPPPPQQVAPPQSAPGPEQSSLPERSPRIPPPPPPPGSSR
ncbi:MAG: FHA domain-containing protein, partial [bacterium]|nr:FHA domain-containing protein [bacterium]